MGMGKMKKARIIYNPTSGREIFNRELAHVLEQFEIAGYITSTHATTGEGDAIEAAEWAAKNHYDLVVAAGGDGTINEVINGIAKMEYGPRIGIIHVGKKNEFVIACDIHM